jgi:transcriptional regulator with XRE-family HTH domain
MPKAVASTRLGRRPKRETTFSKVETSVSLQFEELCEKYDLAKVRVAEAMGVTPSYLSQLVRSNPKMERLEALTEAINTLLDPKDQIGPEYFDSYVALAAVGFLEEHGVAHVLRRAIFGMSASARKAWLTQFRRLK